MGYWENFSLKEGDILGTGKHIFREIAPNIKELIEIQDGQGAKVRFLRKEHGGIIVEYLEEPEYGGAKVGDESYIPDKDLKYLRRIN